MSSFEKVARLLGSFDFSKASMVAVQIISETEDGTIYTDDISTYEDGEIKTWDENHWRIFVATKVKLNQKLGLRPKKVKALSISFTYESWEAYHIENTNMADIEGFDRIILPTITIRVKRPKGVLFMLTPLREYRFRPDEQKLIRGIEDVVLVSKVIDPERLKEVGSSLPLALIDDDAGTVSLSC